MSENNLPVIPWYQSVVIQRIALGVALHLLALFKVGDYFNQTQTADIVNDLLMITGMIADGFAAHARAVRPTPPIVLTKAKADAINAPLAQKSVQEETERPKPYTPPES